MSLVEVSPSTEIMLKVFSVTWWMALSSMAGLMAQSVVTKQSMVAMLGWIMPLPLEMPPTFTVLPPISTSAAASFAMVSVVMMAVAAAWEPSALRAFTSSGMPAWMGSMGSTWPMTPVEATTTSWRAMPKRLGGQIAHGLGLFLAVGVAGVGVSGVADDSLGGAVRDVLLGDQDGRALYQVLGVHSGRRAGLFAVNHGQVGLGFILADAAVDAPGHKALGRCDAAFYHLHRLIPLFA